MHSALHEHDQEPGKDVVLDCFVVDLGAEIDAQFYLLRVSRVYELVRRGLQFSHFVHVLERRAGLVRMVVPLACFWTRA
jgi:hypothetical protein